MKIGCDIAKVARIAEMEDGFIAKYFTTSEIDYCNSKPTKNVAESLTGLFCAKEAFLKAVGTGMWNGIKMQEIEVSHDESGKPTIKYLGEIKEIIALNFEVSISHDDGIAMAVVIAWVV